MNNDALRTLQRYRDALLSLAPVDRTLDGTPEQLARLIREQRATAQAEIAALRAKWEALRGEVEAWRERERTRIEAITDIGNSSKHAMARQANDNLNEARTLTDSTHALEADQ